MNNYIDITNLWKIYGNLDREFCGYVTTMNNLLLYNKSNENIDNCNDNKLYTNLLKKNGELLVLVICGTNNFLNVKDKDRLLCITNAPYRQIIWHTHPNKSKSWPSGEDIIKSLKLRSSQEQLLNCLLFCKWGIWEYNAINKQNISDFCIEQLLDYLNNIWGKLYHITNKGRGELNDKSKEILNEIIIKIKKSLNTYNFNIIFTEWKEIQNNKYYLQYF